MFMTFLVGTTIFCSTIALLCWIVCKAIDAHVEWKRNENTYLIVQKADGSFYLKRRFLFYFWRKYKSQGVVEHFVDLTEARAFAFTLPTYFRKEEKDKVVEYV